MQTSDNAYYVKSLRGERDDRSGFLARSFGRCSELRRELAALLDGVKDLDSDYDSTIELAVHLRDRRATNGQPVDVESVLLDLEACIRSAPPPLLEDVRHGASRFSCAELTAAVESARAELDRRIRDHLAIARTALYG